MGNYGHPSNVDPSLGLDPAAIRQQQHSPYHMSLRNTTPQNHPTTVTPQALQQAVPSLQNTRPTASPFQVRPRSATHNDEQSLTSYQISKPAVEQFVQNPTQAAFFKYAPNPEYEIPNGRKSGGLYIVDQAALAKATKSTALNKLVNLGTQPHHLATNRSKHSAMKTMLCNDESDCYVAALPLYTARQSLKDLKKAGADNKKLSRLSSTKSSLSKARKSDKTANSLKREVTDSESYTDSSDDDSEYTDSEDEEPSPLPASRPDEPHAAVCYDIIKATWYPRKSQPGPEKIKTSMRDIWEVLNTIQKRWRADSKAVSDAEEQKKIGELPVLKSRVASQRDLLQSALKAALDHAHPDVLYHLGQIKPLLYLCYQFLANRFKAKDYDGSLSAVIYEILSRCGTLTTELLEETKVSKALVSMKKHANEKHKTLIQQITDSAASGSKKAKTGSPPRTESTEVKGAKRPAAEPMVRQSTEGPTTKKLKPSDLPPTPAKKDGDATAAPKSTLPVLQRKKPGEKPGTAPAPVKARVNQVANKPSGIFASLNAASKRPAPVATAVQQKPAPAAAKEKKPVAPASKPTFSFASTMASLLKPKEQEVAPVKSEKQLPPETPEEKAKRLRKESRRHLRVTFRPDASLVAIKYFDHVPEEDEGHDENFVRDAGDIGGEGRMFKQHKELDVEEDDDEPETEYRPWTEPSQVDFSVIPSEERERNYVPFGGGEKLPSCPEKEANMRRENATLMVFYSHADDIPSSPNEPPLEQPQEPVPVIIFGTPPDKVLRRCPQTATPAPAPAPASAPTPDLSNLEEIFKQFAVPPPSQPQPVVQAPVQTPYTLPPAAPAAPDLASIINALQGQGLAPPPLPISMPTQAPVQQPMAPGPGLDLAAIMSALQTQTVNGTALPPPPPGFPPFAFPFLQQAQPQQQDGTSYQAQQGQYTQQTNGGPKRQRDDNSNGFERTQGKKAKNRSDRPHKVLACKFFQKGTCNKGDNCTYIHDMNL